MNARRIAITALLSTSAWFGSTIAYGQQSEKAPACAPTNGLNFICNVYEPEDLVPIPGTRWLIASDRVASTRRPGAGIKLIDTEAKTAHLLYSGEQSQQRPDKTMFPTCPEPLDAKTFVSHGLYLRRQPSGKYLLYVVDDRPLQSIQVFTLDASGNVPSLTWTGCVPLPEGDRAYANLGSAATAERLIPNAVAAFSDGTILVSVPRRPGTTPAERFNGSPTGDVLEWRPGNDSFHVIQGAQVPYANGIEISPDEKEFYVAAYSADKVYIFSRQDPLMPLREISTPGFMPDNLRWSGDRLIAAGPMFDEPACGGTELAITGSPAQFGCHRGFMFAQLDPGSSTWKVLAYSEPNPEINVVSTGVVLGDTLWIGASSADGVAYRQLPHLPVGSQ